MKIAKLGCLVVLLFPMLVIVAVLMMFAGGASQTYAATTGGVSLSAQDFADKTGLSITEDQAKNALAFADRLMSEHKFTKEQTAGVLAVAYRESRFDVTAENPSGGVAGFFQWSGWGGTINGDRWSKAREKSLTLDVQLDLMTLELGSTHQKVVENISKTNDPTEAAKIWSRDYEGVQLSDGQSKLDDIAKWAKSINEALSAGQTAFVTDNNTGTSLSSVPEGWKTKGTYNGYAYEGSQSYPAGQCTWYVYNRAKQLGITYDSYMGNGGDWYKKVGYKVSQTPKVHTAVSFVHGLLGSDPMYGHVAFVEQVKDDGSILISEMNVYGQPSMTVSYRVIDGATAEQLWYVDGK